MRRGMKGLVGALALTAAVAGPMSVEASAKTAEEQLAEQLAAAHEQLYRQVLAANEELYRQLLEASGQTVTKKDKDVGKEKSAAAADAAAAGAAGAAAAKTAETPAGTAGTGEEKTPVGISRLLSPEETMEAVLRLNGVLTEDKAPEESAAAPAEKEEEEVRYSDWEGPVLNRLAGTVAGPSGQEYYYNLDMQVVVDRLHAAGFEGEYWVREDGVKMFGDYVMVAAAYWVHPLGTILETTLGTAIVGDTGGFAIKSPYAIDIATNW